MDSRYVVFPLVFAVSVFTSKVYAQELRDQYHQVPETP
jgi:hypothetical protein